MSRKYKFHKPEAAYFISFATVNWVELFTTDLYAEVLIKSITYCRKNKGMELYVYCIMPNHLHMIFRSKDENPSGLIRDFKGFTSKRLIQTIKDNSKESRKDQLLKVFVKSGKTRSNVKKYQLWQQDNHPIELYSDKCIRQKVNYVHMNPVEAGFVTDPEDWKYSSARNYAGDQSVLEIDLMGSKV